MTPFDDKFEPRHLQAHGCHKHRHTCHKQVQAVSSIVISSANAVLSLTRIHMGGVVTSLTLVTLCLDMPSLVAVDHDALAGAC